MKEERSFLGIGWGFPPGFDNKKGTVRMVSEEEDVAESLKILLTTRPGERVMQPNYGCNLDVMLFEPLTTTLITYVEDLVRSAIIYYEPRVELKRVKINTEKALKGLVLIEIGYLVQMFNSRFNLVYPFYLEESNDVNAELLKGNIL